MKLTIIILIVVVLILLWQVFPYWVIKRAAKKKKVVKEKINYNTLTIRPVSKLDEMDRDVVKKEYKHFLELVKKFADEETVSQKEIIESHNGNCPSCIATSVRTRIDNTNESTGYGSSRRLTSVTTIINVCNNCNHEWDHRDNRIHTWGPTDVAENLISLLRYHHDAKHKTKFNPNKLNNEYDNLEDTIEAAIAKVRKSYFFDLTMRYLNGKSVEMVKYLVEEVYGESHRSEYRMERWEDYDKAPLLDWGMKQL